VRAKWGEAQAEELEATRVTVAVAGRIMAIRAQGKAGFATLQQEGERLQIYVRLDAVGEQDSRSTSCSTWATTSACQATCSARAQASSRSTWRG